MKKYTDFIYRFKKLLIGVLVLSVVMSIIGVFRIRFDTDFAMFSTSGTVYEQRLSELEEIFGELNQIIVLVETDEFTNETVDQFYTIQESLLAMDSVTSIQGVAPTEIMYAGSAQDPRDIEVTDLIDYYSQLGDFAPLVLKDNVYYSSFTLFITDQFTNTEVNEVEDLLSSNELTYYISGDTYNQTKITDYIFRILMILPPLAFITIFLVFRWQMGAIKPTVFSVLPAGVGSLWTLGIIGWMGNEVSILTAVVPIFIIVIGSADGLHFMSHYQDSKKENQSTHNAITKTLTIVGIPMIVTTLTSMAGFLSLLSIQTSSIFDLAVFSAVGILFAGIATWYVLPLILSHEINVLPKNKDRRVLDLSLYVKKLWGYKSFVIIGVILVMSAFAYPHIKHEFDMLMVYKNYTEVAENAQKIQEVNGGSIPLYVTFEFEDDPISLTNLNESITISDDMILLDSVSKVVNPYALLDTMYQMSFDTEIPSNLALAFLYGRASQEDTSPINNLIARDEQVVRFIVFPTDLTNETLEEIETFAMEHNATVTGVQYMIRDLNLSISEMQIYSIVLALSVVFVMMFFTLRSFKIAILSLLPIVITVAALYGALGITGISLNITTVIIFSITIGVGIDYAVHFSSVYQYYLKQGLSKEDAVSQAYQNSSRPIITNALGISLGLSMMMLSPLNIHFNVSVLMWVSMVVSVLVTLTFLPTIFRGRNNK